MISITILFTSIGFWMFGAVLGYFARLSIAKKQLGSVEAKLDQMLNDARGKAQEIILAAQQDAVKVLEDVKKEEKERQVSLRKTEERIIRREEILEKRAISYENREKELEEKIAKVKEIKEQIERIKEQRVGELEKVAAMPKEKAKEELFSQIEDEYKTDLIHRMEKLEKDGYEELEKKTRDIMTVIMQRYASSQAVEVSTSTVALPSDEIKGKIIGKEGRNIKALERSTGVEIIIDETPEAITLSCFDPVRRQIAKIAIERLIEDGRIQPARIEEVVEKTAGEINAKIKEIGEAAAYEVGVVGLDPKIIHLLGRLHFRTSYGQNVLMHSLEAAHLSAMLAEELGADVKVVKKAALLHDIGKAVDHEIQGTHVEIGRKILLKFGVEEEVIKAMQSHHEEYPYETLESIIVHVGESLSASRPGARRGTVEAYLKRLEDLEKIAKSFAGVEKAYAIQAGREIRIFVKPEILDDLAARKLAREIADRVEQEIGFPGEIKVNVIRETRVIEYAK